MNEHKSPIPSRIYNAAVGGHICGTEDIIDDDKNKTQKQINSEIEESLGTGGSVDFRIASAVATEANRAQSVEENLRQLYNSLSQSQPIPVTALPATGEAGKIYRLAGTTSYADYMYAEGALTTPIKMAEYDNAIDDEPVAESDNLVKSGGVEKSIADINFESQSNTITRNVGVQTSNVITLKHLIQKGTKFSFKVSSDLGFSNYRVYVTYEGQTEHTGIGNYDVFDTPIQLIAENNIIGVDIYMLEQATRNGYLKLTVSHDTLDNIAILYDNDNLVNTDISQLNTNINSRNNYFEAEKTIVSGQSASTPKINVFAQKGETISFKLNAPNNIVSEFYFYVFKKGQTEHTNVGLYSANVEHEVTLGDDIYAVDVYIPNTIGAGTVTLHVNSAIISEIKNIEEELHSKVFNEYTLTYNNSSGASVSPDNTGKLKVDIKQGSSFKFIVENQDRNIKSITAVYAIYKGTSERVSLLLYDIVPNKEYYITAVKDIDYFCIYVESSVITGAYEFTLSVKTNSIDYVTNANNNILHPIFKKNIITTSNSALDPDRTAYIGVDIKQGEKFSFIVKDPYSSLSSINAFYAKYKGDTDRTNLMIASPMPNVVYELTAARDIDYIAFYVQNTSIVTNGQITLQVDGYGLIDKVEDLSHNEVQIDVEKENVVKRYLPYTICMKQNPYYVADNRLFQFACNLLFFTDSHTDETFFDGVNIKNVKYVVNFANRLKNNIHDVSEQFVNTQVFDAVINAGDIISSGYKVTSEHDVELALPFFNEIKNLNIPFIIAKGNHDTLIPDTAWASMYGDWAEQKFGLVRQTKKNTHKSTWSYYDIESKKIRVIAIDVTDIDLSVLGQDGYPLYNGGNSWYIAQEQMNWLINTALNFDSKDDSDWGVVCVLHQSKQIMWNNEWYAGSRLYNIPSAIEKFFEVCKAFNNQSTYSDTYTFPTDTFYNLSINADFTRYASTKKWKQYTYTQNSGSAGSGKYAYYIKKDTGLTVRMDDTSGNLTQYHLYVWYEGASDYTHIQVCQPNQEYTIQLNDNIVGVQIYVNANEITENVNATFKILENKPHIVCWLNGHEHSDKQLTIDGINIIWTLNGAAMTAYSDQRVLRNIGTPTQNAFDCISIDTINRKIRIIRYGAGINCFGEGGDRFLPDGLSY